MPPLTAQTFPHLAQCDALSPASLASHLRLYQGYVEKYNALDATYHKMLRQGPAAHADLASLKGDLAFALGAIRNHELYFDILGEESDGPSGPLADLLVKSFHSLPQFLIDLKQTAQQGRNWVFTAYDLQLGHLFNYDAGSQNGLPVWNAVPLLTIDLYGHAYFYDFGNSRIAYIETLMKSLRWPAIAARLQSALASSPKAVP